MQSTKPSYFKNSVEIPYATEERVITNPENRLVVAGNMLQLGKSYFRLSTIWNWLKNAIFFYFKR